MRRILFFVVSSLLAISSVFAEDKIVMPEYPGGREALQKYIESNLVYPTTARKLEMTGEVVVEFTVERGGMLTSINVVKGLAPELDEEALRVVQGMGRWIPGTKNGVPVRVTMKMPINFKLHKVNGFLDESKENAPGTRKSKRAAARRRAAQEAAQRKVQTSAAETSQVEQAEVADSVSAKAQ